MKRDINEKRRRGKREERDIMRRLMIVRKLYLTRVFNSLPGSNSNFSARELIQTQFPGSRNRSSKVSFHWLSASCSVNSKNYIK